VAGFLFAHLESFAMPTTTKEKTKRKAKPKPKAEEIGAHEYLTTKEAAALLRISRLTLGVWVREGRIKASAPGQKFLFSRKELDLLLEKPAR
jgi:excisionase family DNA binding protein